MIKFKTGRMKAREERAELIVIASHGLTGWRRLVHGSVAEKVVRLASCPVLTIAAPPEAAACTSKSPVAYRRDMVHNGLVEFCEGG